MSNNQGILIGLDIGHGVNTYPPSKGVPGLPEHTFNAEVGIRLKKLLEFNGFKVILGQEPYKNDVPLSTRIKLYNDKKVNLVWSIHANASSNTSARGLASFYWSTSEKSKKLANLYVEEVSKMGYKLWGGARPSVKGTWSDFAICRSTNSVANLTENGFMTNAEDKALLLSDKFRDDIAEAHLKTICRYFGIEAKLPSSDLYRVRKSWEDVKSQLGAFKNLDSAKKLADENKGYKVFEESGKVVYEPKSEPVQTKPTSQPEDKCKGHNDIMGKSAASSEKMAAFVKSKNPNALNIDEIAKAFIKVGEKYNVRGDVAFCQSIIETGWFKFDGGTSVTPDQHNYCGMGVTSKGMKGNSFATVGEGVLAQIQHLFAYACKDNIPQGDAIVDPRYRYVTRGIAPHWECLNGKWAMNNRYGQHIISLYKQLLDFVPPIVEEKPIIENPKEDVPASNPQPEPIEVVEDEKPIESEQPSKEEKMFNLFTLILEFLLLIFGKKK
jgi:N-acetylmuramoyl-L-alanine amidase